MAKSSSNSRSYTALDELSEILNENNRAHETSNVIETAKVSTLKVLEVIDMFKKILDEEWVDELVRKLNFLNHRSKISAGKWFMQSFWRDLHEVKTADELIYIIFEIEHVYDNNEHKWLNWLECSIWLESYLTWVRHYIDTHEWNWDIEYDVNWENPVDFVMKIIQLLLDNEWINSLNRKLRYLTRYSRNISLNFWIKLLWIRNSNDLKNFIKELDSEIENIKKFHLKKD